MATFAEQYKKNKSGTLSGGSTFAERFKSSDIGKTVRDDYERKLAERKVAEKQRVIDDSNAKAEKYYQESTGGVLNTINRFLDPIIGGTKAVGATAKDVLTPWNNTVTPSVTYQGVEYKTPGQKGVEGGQKIAQGQVKQGLGQVGEGILDVAQFIPVGGAVVRGATKAVPIMQGLKNLGSFQGLKTAGVNLLKNKSVQQNAALMGGYGATGAMQEDQGAGGIALETAKGVGIGAGAGLAFEGAGSLIGRAFTNLFEKIGTRPRVQIDETVARETVDEITDIQGKPPTPEEEDAILEAFANGATKEEIITEVGKAKVADGFEVKPKLAEVVDQLEANGEKLSLEDTMAVKTALDEGKSFEEIQTSLRTPELAVKSTPEPRKVESDTNTPDKESLSAVEDIRTYMSNPQTGIKPETVKAMQKENIIGGLDFDKDGKVTLYRVGELKDGQPQSYSLTKKFDTQEPVKVSKEDVVVNTTDPKLKQLFEQSYPDTSATGNSPRKIYLDGLEHWNKQEAEVIAISRKRGNDSDYLLTAKEATKREKEILSDMKSKERALAKMEKATLDEEKFLARQSESTFIGDPEEQHNYQSFKDLLRRFKGEKQRQELLNGDASSIKRVLGDKLKSQELDNILYSTDQSKSEDEMLDYFRGIYEKDKEKITSDMLAKKAQKRLESDPDYAKLQDELSSVKERKLALEKAEQKTLDEVNKELAQQKPEIIEPKKVEAEKEVKPKTSVIASRLNEALPEGFKIDESYDPKVIKEEIDKASQTIFKDKEAAIKKAFDPNTNPVERDAILIELSEIAKRDGDFDAVADLFQRRAELIRSGAQSLNMEKASILLNPQEKYMRDIVNSRLGSVKVNGKDLTEVEVSAIRKIVRRETSEATKKAFKIQDAEELFKSLICT